MKKVKVIYLGPNEGFESASKELGLNFELFNLKPNSKEINQHIVDADAILDASMKTQIDDNLLDKAKNLKIISCATTGSDHISNKSIIEKEISLNTLKEDKNLIQNLTPAAELSWTLLLACARKLNSALNDVKAGNWDREKFPGVMLNGKTIGIIGCGRIGLWMARYARAFGMNIIGYDPKNIDLPEYITQVDLDEIFKNSDFITLHVHLSDETRGLVSSSLIKKCKKNVIIINTSRGQIIDETALLEGLKNGNIGAVGLDVVSDEPNIEKSSLVKYAVENENVLITPHCGGFSPDAVKIVCRRAAEKIKNYYK